MTKPTTVRIYPVPDAYISGVSAVEQELPIEEADVLLAYQPPAFSTDPPPPPATPPPGPVEKTGPTDIRE